jgi:predicted O-methyltransferase YrrM
MIEYMPAIRETVSVVNVVSAWGEIPTILKDIIIRFDLKTNSALEFGVEEGYSTTALSHYFKNVKGVDTFRNDCWDNSMERPSQYLRVVELLKDYKNITLVEDRFETFIQGCNERFDLIHIDIIHSYRCTYDCGEWAMRHADCVIFHDVVSFPEVHQAVEDLALKYGFINYIYPYDNGLGIAVKIK